LRAGPNRICLWTPAAATTEEVVDKCPAEMREDGCYQANGVVSPREDEALG
jgi:hypothetical protein